MDITILIPHYKQWKITCYTVYQFLKYTEGTNIEIVVINNSYPDESIKYLEPFRSNPRVKIIDHITNQCNSHGIAYEFALKDVKTKYVLLSESDCFPTRPFIEYLDLFVRNDYDLAGNIMQLSGGRYLHPASTLMKVDFWREVKQYYENSPYHYLSNFGMVDGFAAHVMVHNDVWDFFLQKPNAFVDLPEDKKNCTKEDILENERFYKSIAHSVMHNGMGMVNETVDMIGQRSHYNQPQQILLTGREKIVHRIGYEPGQAIFYMALAMGKKVCEIPVEELVWMPGRENMQQEYTLSETGCKHLWGCSSFAYSDLPEIKDIIERKNKLPEELYSTLPEELKVKMLPQ